MLKFGVIKQYDGATGLAKVDFEADNIVSDFLPILFRKTLNEKESAPFDEKEHVACLMDENCEHGVILGAIYSTVDAPLLTSPDQFGIKFQNGDYFYYDRSSNELKHKTGSTEFTLNNTSLNVQNGATIFKMDSNTGKFTITNGGESLKMLLADICNAIAAITVTATAASVAAPSPVPINNLASFPPLVTRINAFLT